jgi:hypothetical protein
MSEMYEEHFAPDPDTEEFKMGSGPKRRIVTHSDNTEVVKLLKKENLQQIKDALENESSDDDEETSNRYLRLELVNKELDIDVLTNKLSTLQVIVDEMNTFNDAINTINNNITLYNELINDYNTEPYHDLIKKEIKGIKPYHTVFSNILPINVHDAFYSTYEEASAIEKKKAKEFHDIIFYKNKMSNMLCYLETFFGIIILFLYAYYFLFL